MAKSFVSPGVFTKEIDASFLGAGVGAIGASLIGTATKGPAFVPVTVTSNSEFEEFFGPLDTSHMLTYAARSYLRNSATANIVRVLGPTGRSVNGATVTPGYTADKVYGIVASSGSSTVGLLALVEVTASADLIVTSSAGLDDTANFYLMITGSDSVAPIGHTDPDGFVAVTASFLTASSLYIGNLNTDPTKFAEKGYYVRDIYDYAQHASTVLGVAEEYSSASFALTDFTEGFNSGSSPWIMSQPLAGVESNLFRIHTLGHGEAENGRFKVSIENIKTSANPTVVPFGKFDVVVRSFGDTDDSQIVVQSFTNVTLDPTDPNYVARVIGDKYWVWSESRKKMVENGDFTNLSKFVRIEMTTGSFPQSSLPWGFRGLKKPSLSFVRSEYEAGTTGSLTTDPSDVVLDLPLVMDLKDKKNQVENETTYYWGMETALSGNVAARLTKLPSMTASDTDFSLKNVAGTALSFLSYSAGLAAGQQKAPGDTTALNVLQPDHAKFTVPVAFGFDGFDRRLEKPLENETQLLTVSQLGTQALRQAVDVVSDPDFIDTNLLAIPGVYSSRVVDYGLTAIRNRADAFYVADISGSTPAEVVTELRGRGLDNNYGAMYYPSIRVFDDVVGKAVTVPASVAAVGAIAFNDRVAYPWFAPAGLNRAGLSREVVGFDVLGVTDQLKQTERDDLYEARINPIARFPDVPQGVIWGQKTLQIKASALDRINVRRLLIQAKKLIASAVKYLVFEPGNATTMTRFRQLVNPILADIQQKQGLEAFKVVMDETTSTPELIDRNTLAGKIFLIPTRTAEFISVDFIVSPTGASFDE